MVTCGACGGEISENSRFCSSCGQPLGNDPFATRTVASTSRPPTRSSSLPASSVSSTDQGRFLPGAVLAGRYRIIALLGKGGMGEVYRADDLSVGQQVALKFLPEEVSGNPDAVARFRNEVRIARQVSHPNVCRVYDVGEIDGRLFLSMEYVDGEDLGALLRRIGRLPADKALEIARKLCAGLAAAHEKGVLHRDLKPSNIMLDGRGQALLTDFGLAGIAGQVAGNEVRSGTPAYMAPEQLEGREVTVRSDIYSLGLVLYEVFTGKRPFEADTLAGLVRARKESTPASLTTVVRDLDPGVESAIMRCLDPDPARRPASALAVAAALPGGDPLAAALAAGETPSPQMVAAAGEGTGLAPRVAVPVLLAILTALTAALVLMHRKSAVDKIRPEYSADVLSQKARDLVRRLGYSATPRDSARGFFWEFGVIRHAREHDKPAPRWNDVLSERPSMLRFWYRQSNYPLIAHEFHNDLLTPGIVTMSDPTPIVSGMVNLILDAQGRLVEFQAIPPQREEPAKQEAPAVDWNPLFAAADLDPAKFQSAEPQWTWLAASDRRFAWTGAWPGSGRALRVEAAAWRGKPVVFSLISPWTEPERMPSPDSDDRTWVRLLILAVLIVLVCFGAALLARRNLLQGRGDRRGAFRLAVWIFSVHMALWLTQSHFVASMGTFAMFLLAICTSVFYGALIWTVYVALEPYVRRHWPRTLIAWTDVLTGRMRAPIVGRDILYGVGLGVSWVLMGSLMGLLMRGEQAGPTTGSASILHGFRSTIGLGLMYIPYAVRTTLIFFFLLFLLRALLRNEWLAGAAFILVFGSLSVVGSEFPLIAAVGSAVIYGSVAVVALRWGLLALAVGMVVNNLLVELPVTTNYSAWYFTNAAFLLAAVLALTLWAFRASMAGRRLWKRTWLE